MFCLAQVTLVHINTSFARCAQFLLLSRSLKRTRARQMRDQAFRALFLGRIKVPACAVKTKLDTRRESFCLSFGQALRLPAITIIILFIV
jgi:hypothetical protein